MFWWNAFSHIRKRILMLDATFWVTFLWNVSVLLFYLGTFICVLNWIWSCKGNQISSDQISSSDVSYFIAKSNVPSFLPSLFWSVVVADCSICSSVDVPFPLHRYKVCLACFYHGRMFVECCSLTVVSCQVQEIWHCLRPCLVIQILFYPLLKAVSVLSYTN